MARPAPRSTAADGFEPQRRGTLEAILKRAPFEGWTAASLAAAARDAGLDRAALAAAFPRGVADILSYWSLTTDEAMEAALADPAFEPLKIREKVAFAVKARLDLLRPYREAARRAAATLVLPFYGTLGPRLAWNTADAIWRGLDDTSTDFNFYTKRAILTGVWTTTFARWLADDDPGEAATNAFLKARIDNVMQFEKLKAKAKKFGLDPAKPAGWFAKKRYPEPTARASEELRVDEALAESFPASDPPYFAGGGGT